MVLESSRPLHWVPESYTGLLCDMKNFSGGSSEKVSALCIFDGKFLFKTNSKKN